MSSDKWTGPMNRQPSREVPRFEDEAIEMQPGNFVNIPAHKRHRVEWTTPDEPTIWLADFYE